MTFSPGLEFPGGLEMKSRSRAVTAIGLGASLWFTTVATLASPQKADPNSSSTQNDQKNAKPAQAKQPATQTASNRTLSTNDDPTMIGKRNINKGVFSHGI